MILIDDSKKEKAKETLAMRLKMQNGLTITQNMQIAGEYVDMVINTMKAT